MLGYIVTYALFSIDFLKDTKFACLKGGRSNLSSNVLMLLKEVHIYFNADSKNNNMSKILKKGGKFIIISLWANELKCVYPSN